MQTAPSGIENARHLAIGPTIHMAKMVLEPALQPIVEASTGTIFGYESLMRGFDRIGFQSPPELLDYMQNEGQLLTLEQMMVSRALGKFSGLKDHVVGTLFINLDVRLIAHGEEFLDHLLDQLAQAMIAPSSICFELSERFDNTRVPEFNSLMARMRREGFKLAIDDFGVGHGELKLLCDYPVDYLKIDRHFIGGIDQNPRKRHLIKNVVNIAHMLGVKVIAEGIETQAEFLACKEYGVDLVQGWFIAKPTVFTTEIPVSFPHLRNLGAMARGGQSLDEILIRQQIECLPTVYENDTIDSVFELFRRNPAQAFFPVLNANDEPRGVIAETHLKEYIYQPFGRDLLKNKFYERTISHFVDRAPIVGINADTHELMTSFANTDGSVCVILTDNMRYVGVVSAASLIKVVNEKQLKIAQEQNPLTALPGNRAITQYIESNCDDGDEARFFCYCDFDNFKPFNDKYGFHVGDMAISLFAALIRRYFFSGDCFLGHVGGDDFFIGVRDWEPKEVEEILERLLDDFHEDVLELYSPEDRKAGQIRGHDRYGNEREFPLLRCSIGVLILQKDLILGQTERISAGIASIKQIAKESQDGLVMRYYSETF